MSKRKLILEFLAVTAGACPQFSRSSDAAAVAVSCAGGDHLLVEGLPR